MKAAVAILISGRGSNMQALIEAAAAADYPARIVLVVSNRGDAPGLGIAASAGIETLVFANRDFASREAQERAIDVALRARAVAAVCLAGYMRLLTPFLVRAWAGRMLNIHPSLLPEFAGLNTHAQALAAGAAQHGCTVHLVSEAMDAGPILAQARMAVLPGDDETRLAARVLAQEHQLYPAALAAHLRQILPELAPAR